MKRTAIIAVILVLPGGLLLTIVGASLGIGAFETFRQDAMAIKHAISLRMI